MHKRIQTLVVFLSILTIDISQAQISKVDSLENLLKYHKAEDTVKVILLNEIAFLANSNDIKRTRAYAILAAELSVKLKFPKGEAESYSNLGISYGTSDVLMAIDNTNKALKIAERINYKKGIADYLNRLGVFYWKKGENDKAYDYCNRAIKIAEEIKNKDGLARFLLNLSILYSSEGKYEKAIEGNLKVLKLTQELGDMLTMGVCFSNLGSIYEFQGNYPQALAYYQKSLEIKEKLNNKITIIHSLISISTINLSQNDSKQALEQITKAIKIAEEIDAKQALAACFSVLGTIYQKTNNPQALDYFQKALKISETLLNKTLISKCELKIGEYHFSQGNYQNALENYQKAIKIAEEMGKKRIICEIGNNIGTVYFKQKNYAQALNYSLKSLAIADALKLLSNQKEIHQQIAEIYAATNDYRNAYNHHIIYKELNDSIFNEKNIKKITGLEYTYKYEKEIQANELVHQKEVAIQTVEKKQQNAIIFFLIVGFLLMFSFAGFIFRSYRIKRRTNIILIKQKTEIEELNEEYQAVNEELKQTNEQLYFTKNLVEESEEKLQLLIKNSNDIFVLANEKGEQFFISDVAKNLTGYTVEELLGSVEDVIYHDDLEIVKQHWSRVLADKNLVDTIQYRHKHKEKGFVWFEAVTQNFLDYPAIKAVVANIRDITERKKIEQDLKESEEAKAQLMAKEMERINTELETNQKSITSASLKLIQNAERDSNTIERLMEIETNTNPTGNQKINTLISDYKRSSYNSNWDEFEILFEKVHGSFYEKLNTQFPTLTANDRKICAFLKLNMSNKDIAHITFQSDEALKKARMRLRQKLGLDRETNLTAFLQNI